MRYMTDTIVEGRVADYIATAFERAVLRSGKVEAIKGDIYGAIDMAIVGDGPVEPLRQEHGAETMLRFRSLAPPSSLRQSVLGGNRDVSG